MQLPKWHRKAVLCTGDHFSNAFDFISKKKPRLIHLLLGAGLTLRAFLLPAHTRSHLLPVDSLHPLSSGTAGEERQCGGKLCEEEPLWWFPGYAGQLRNSSHNLPTHLPVHSCSTQEASLEINLMFEEITALLQMCAEISSSVHLGHSAILLCLPGLKI